MIFNLELRTLNLELFSIHPSLFTNYCPANAGCPAGTEVEEYVIPMSPDASGRKGILKISPIGRNDRGADEMTEGVLDSGSSPE